MKVPIVGTAWSRFFMSNPERRGKVRYVKKIDFELKKVITVPDRPGTPGWTHSWRYHDLRSWHDKYGPAQTEEKVDTQ